LAAQLFAVSPESIANLKIKMKIMPVIRALVAGHAHHNSLAATSWSWCRA
jgi:hypothetical protein